MNVYRKFLVIGRIFFVCVTHRAYSGHDSSRHADEMITITTDVVCGVAWKAAC